MGGIASYLWWLAPAFLKKREPVESLVYALLTAIGEELDEAKTTILAMRRQLLVSTAEGVWLATHGRDRIIDRIPGESDDSYRARLLAAFLAKQQGGTTSGMIAGCALLGLDVEVVERYLTDPTRWSEFEIVVRGGVLRVANPSLFYDVVLALKPAHTRVLFTVEPPLDEFDDGESLDDGYFDEFHRA